MDFITAPLICGIVFYFIYMVFELFGRRKERMMLIEKLGQNADPKFLESKMSSLLPNFSNKSFTGLKIGCLLMGIGFGLLVGLLICSIFKISEEFNIENYSERDMFFSVAYGSSTLLFGGLGLIIAHLIENRERRKEKEKEH